MPVKFIVTLLILASLLAGAVYWMGRTSAIVSPPAALVEIDPAKVTSVEVRWAGDGSIASTVSRAADGTWVMRWRSGDASGTWPVIGSRVAGAIKLLTAVKGTAETSVEALGDPVWITLRSPDSSVTIEAAKRSFGGRGVLVRRADAPSASSPQGSAVSPADGRRGGGVNSALAAEVDGELVQVFQRADILAWRDLSLFAAETSQTARIALQSADGATRLQRVGGRWGVMEPMQVRADRAAIEGFLAALKKLRIARFPGDQPGWTGAADDPFAESIIIESDRKLPDGDASSRWVLRQRLDLAPFAGDESMLARATVSIERAGKAPEVLWGPTLVVVDKATARDVLRPAESFASRLATSVVTADVRRLTVASGDRTLTATRSIDEWLREPGGTMTLVERDGIRSIIDLLTAGLAMRIERASDESVPPGAGVRVELLGAAGPPLDSAMVFVRGSGDTRELVVRSESVNRIHGADAAAVWEEALAHLGMR